MILLKTVSKKPHDSGGAVLLAAVLLLWGVTDLQACESATPRRFIDLLTNMEKVSTAMGAARSKVSGVWLLSRDGTVSEG